MESEIDFSACCRTCLRTNCDLIPLSAIDEDSVRFSFKLVSCISEIAWLQDNRLTVICDCCIEQLRVSFDFRNTCILANDTFKKKCIKRAQLDVNCSEYLSLKHFLRSDGASNKYDSLDIETGSTGIEPEIKDIKEEFTLDNPDAVGEQNKFLSYIGLKHNFLPNLQLEIAEENSDTTNRPLKCHNTGIQKYHTQSKAGTKKCELNKHVSLGDDDLVSLYENAECEEILDSSQGEGTGQSDSDADYSIDDQDYDINNCIYDGEKLDDVRNSECDDINSQNNLLIGEFSRLYRNATETTSYRSNFNDNYTENSIDIPIVNNKELNVSFVEKLNQRKLGSNKLVKCRFCDKDIFSKNFVRHLERQHCSEKEVVNIMSLPKNSKQRKSALSLFRNETNFNLYLTGQVHPKRLVNKWNTKAEYYPCIYCKGIFRKTYLRLHVKSCSAEISNKNTQQCLSMSQTFTACQLDPTNIISKLNVKEKVFHMMRPDEISFEAKKDLLIVQFGDSYLKKYEDVRNAHACSDRVRAYACSSRMRELSRLLITFRKLKGDKNADFKDLIHPKNFNVILTAVRKLSGHDPLKNTLKAPSLAIHFGKSLKVISDELINLILKKAKGFTHKNKEDTQQWLENIKHFKMLVQSRWNIEMAFLRNKEQQEKKLIKKTGWTDQEIQLLKARFGSCIERKTYPSTNEIVTFCYENNIRRTPVVVKSKLQHLMRKF